ncbi:MAG: hypothetical protein EOP42_13940 [Sphingobacteriaceae bacterium]|nr:MAG: hypothetical protein EOP42_13940 [Sphingobacteriaceae bacterium]
MLDDELFRQSAEPLILLKTDSPYFTIVKYNEVFQIVSRTVGMDLTGKSMPEIHKWNSDNEDSALLIHDLLNEVITKKETVTLPAVRYDLPALPGEQVQPSWWQAVYEPVLAADGSVEYILCITRDITAQMIAEGK